MQDEDYEVEFLKQRLISLREESNKLFTGKMLDSKTVSNHLRKEVVDIYDEHGGADILTQLTHIGVNHIIQWHSQWKKNPLCFEKPTKQKEVHQKSSFVDEVLKKPKVVKDILPAKRIRNPEMGGITNSIDAWNSLQPHDRLRCQYIKDLIDHNRKKGGLGITDEVRDEVGILARDLGDSHKIALCLGLEDTVVDKWKKYYDDMIEEEFAVL